MKHIDPRFLDLETKAEGDDTDPVATALAEFRASLDARLTAFETKSSTRMDGLEARMNRPGAGLETKAASIEDRAFATYLRRGTDPMGDIERKALSVGSMGDGGYLANPQYGAELLKLITLASPLRAYATAVTSDSRSITYPRRLGIQGAQWVGEGVAVTPTGPTFENMTITPGTLKSECPVSLDVLEDNSYDLEGQLLQWFGEEFAISEGAAFIHGTGVNQPNGILSSADPRIHTMTTGDANTLGADPAGLIIKAFHALPTIAAQAGVWLMNRQTLGTLRGVRDTIGRPILLDGLVQGAPSTLMGRPVAEMPDMPAIASGAVPIVFGDIRTAYRIVDRVQPSIFRDPFTLLSTSQVRFVARRRVGGDITSPDRLLKIQVGA